VGSLWYFSKGLQSTLIIFTLSITPYHSPSFPPPFLQKFQQVSLFYFHISMYNTLAIFIFLHPLCSPFLFPLVPNPTNAQQDLFYDSSSIFKCVFIVQRGFAIVSHTWMYCALIRLNTSTNLSFPIPLPPEGWTAGGPCVPKRWKLARGKNTLSLSQETSVLTRETPLLQHLSMPKFLPLGNIKAIKPDTQPDTADH
jgi:hypothetical protein